MRSARPHRERARGGEHRGTEGADRCPMPRGSRARQRRGAVQRGWLVLLNTAQAQCPCNVCSRAPRTVRYSAFLAYWCQKVKCVYTHLELRALREGTYSYSGGERRARAVRLRWRAAGAAATASARPRAQLWRAARRGRRGLGDGRRGRGGVERRRRERCGGWRWRLAPARPPLRAAAWTQHRGSDAGPTRNAEGRSKLGRQA